MGKLKPYLVDGVRLRLNDADAKRLGATPVGAPNKAAARKAPAKKRSAPNKAAEPPEQPADGASTGEGPSDA